MGVRIVFFDGHDTVATQGGGPFDRLTIEEDTVYGYIDGTPLVVAVVVQPPEGGLPIYRVDDADGHVEHFHRWAIEAE